MPRLGRKGAGPTRHGAASLVPFLLLATAGLASGEEAPRAGGRATVVLIGDSVLDCKRTGEKQGAAYSLEATAEALLGAMPAPGHPLRGAKVVNLSIGATGTPHWWVDQVLCVPETADLYPLMGYCSSTKRFVDAVRLAVPEPTVAVLVLGVNDVKAEGDPVVTVDRLEAMAAFLRPAVVFHGAVHPASSDEPAYQAFASALNRELDSRGLVSFRFPNVPTRDGLHPTNEGCVMAGAALGAFLAQVPPERLRAPGSQP